MKNILHFTRWACLAGFILATPAFAQPDLEPRTSLSLTVSGWSAEEPLDLDHWEVTMPGSGFPGAEDRLDPCGLVTGWHITIVPGRTYTLSLAESNLNIAYYQIDASVPAGYIVEIAGIARKRYITEVAGFYTVRVVPEAGGIGGRAGTASSITGGKVFWQLSLGSLMNGEPARTIGIIDPGTGSWNDLYTPLGLVNYATSADVEAYRNPADSGLDRADALKQIRTNEAFVEIVPLTATSYEIVFYSTSRNGAAQSSAPYTIKKLDDAGSLTATAPVPYVRYKIEKDSESATKLNITRTTYDSSGATAVLTETTSIERAGAGTSSDNFEWVVEDWHTGSTAQVIERRVWSTNSTGRKETVTIEDADETVTSKVVRQFHTYQYLSAFSKEELVSTTRGMATDSDPAVVDSVAYYDRFVEGETNGDYAFANNTLNLTHPAVRQGNSGSGRWEAYEYFGIHEYLGAPPTALGPTGLVKRRFRPFTSVQSVPIGDPSGWATSQVEVTTYDYDEKSFAFKRATSITTTVKDIPTEKSTIAYGDPQQEYVPGVGTNVRPHILNALYADVDGPKLNLVVATRTDQTTNSAAADKVLKTVTKYHREDVVDDLYRNQLHSVKNPDGTMVAFAYQRGTFEAATGLFTKDAPETLFKDHGDSVRVVKMTGTSQSAGATAQPTFDGYQIADNDDRYTDDFYVVPDKSTMEVSIRDASALVRRTETRVWHVPSSGPGAGTGVWETVAWVKYTYDDANRLLRREASNGGVYTADYTGGRLLSETDENGNTATYTYNAAGRVETSTISGTSPIGSIVTTYGYDTSGHVITRTVSSTSTNETLTYSFTYDGVGRLKTESIPGPQQGGSAITSYTYDPVNRKITTTLPRPATTDADRTIIKTYNPNGTLASIGGSAAIAASYSYDATTGGQRHTKVAIGGSSSRVSESWADWLGRTVKTSRPGFGTNGAFEEEAIYDDVFTDDNTSTLTGRLGKSTATFSSTAVSTTLYEYDALSQVVRSGQRLSNTGTTIGTLTNASSDRIVDSTQSFEKVGDNWWLTTTATTYPTTDDDTSKLVSVNRTRLSNFTGTLTGFSGGTLRAETQSTDINGNTTVQQVYVDPADTSRTTKIVTTVLDSSGSAVFANHAVETVVCGLTTGVQTFDGLSYSTEYDALWRPHKSKDARALITTTNYTENTTFVSDIVDSADPANTVATYTYDNAGRVIAVQDAAGNVTCTDYDLHSRVRHQWGGNAYPVEHVYDDFGQEIELHTYQPDKNDTTEIWNGATTWPTVTISSITKWVYDGATGLLKQKTHLTDPADANSGQTVEFTYNIRGQVASRKWARAVSANNSDKVTTTYAYMGDATGELKTGELNSVSYNDGTPTVAYDYTRLGQINTINDHVTGVSTFGYGTAAGSNFQQLDSILLGTFYGGRTIAPQYDSVHRAAGFTVGTEIDQAHHYRTDGRFDYVTSTPSGQTARTFTYAYQSGGLPGGYSVGSLTVDRTYDDNRPLLNKVETKWDSTSQVCYDYTFTKLGQRKTATQSGLVFDDLGTITHGYIYNARGEVVSATAYYGTSASGTQLAGRNHYFDYDAAGNRSKAGRTGSTGVNDVFTPNALNQYASRENNVVHVAGTVSAATTSVTAIGGSPPPSVHFSQSEGRYWDTQAMFDNIDHPKKDSVTVVASKPGSGGGAAVVGAQTREAFIPQREQAFAYDADGNLLADGVWNYTWDAENRLTHMVSDATAVSWLAVHDRQIDFAYDYAGRRVSKRVRDFTTPSDQIRRYLYDGDNLIAEFDGSDDFTVACGALQRSYTWGLDLAGSLGATGGVGALLQITDHLSDLSYFPAYDGNGNVVALLQANGGGAAGSIVAKYEYSPFGELLRAEGPYAKSNPFRFSTKFTDEETGLVYYGARYYSPSLGRFINRDPIEEAGGLNLYGFCGNDGVNGFDVGGMFRLPAPPTRGVSENPKPPPPPEDDNYTPGFRVYAPASWDSPVVDYYAFPGVPSNAPNTTENRGISDRTRVIATGHSLPGPDSESFDDIYLRATMGVALHRTDEHLAQAGATPTGRGLSVRPITDLEREMELLREWEKAIGSGEPGAAEAARNRLNVFRQNAGIRPPRVPRDLEISSASQPRNALGQFMPKSPGQTPPGQSAVDHFVAQAQRNGYQVMGREVTFKTLFGPRRYDVILRDPVTGRFSGIEIKSSEAAMNRGDAAARQQFAADRWINLNGGATSVGGKGGIIIESTYTIQWTPF